MACWLRTSRVWRTPDSRSRFRKGISWWVISMTHLRTRWPTSSAAAAHEGECWWTADCREGHSSDPGLVSRMRLIGRVGGVIEAQSTGTSCLQPLGAEPFSSAAADGRPYAVGLRGDGSAEHRPPRVVAGPMRAACRRQPSRAQDHAWHLLRRQMIQVGQPLARLLSTRVSGHQLVVAGVDLHLLQCHRVPIAAVPPGGKEQSSRPVRRPGSSPGAA